MTDLDVPAHSQTLPDPWNAMLLDSAASRVQEVEDGLLGTDEIERMMADDQGVIETPGTDVLAQSVATPDRILSALRPIGEKIGIGTTREIRNALAILADFSFVDVSYARLGAFLAHVPIPSLMSPLLAAGGSPTGLIVVDRACASLYLDSVLGGGQSHVSQTEGSRPYSAIEMRLFEGFVSALLTAIGPGLLPHCDIPLTSKGVETQPRYLALGKYTDSVVRFRFKFQIDKRRGIAEIVFTGDVLARLEKALLPARIVSKPENDDAWRQRLVAIAAGAMIDLDLVLAEVQFSFRHLQALQIGDTLPLGIAQSTPVRVCSHNKTLGQALIGRAGPKMAIRMLGPVTAS